MGESSAGHVPVMVDTVVALLGSALESDGAVLLDGAMVDAASKRLAEAVLARAGLL